MGVSIDLDHPIYVYYHASESIKLTYRGHVSHQRYIFGENKIEIFLRKFSQIVSFISLLRYNFSLPFHVRDMVELIAYEPNAYEIRLSKRIFP